ncbi:MAG: rhamnogalacturonan acetylesterase [Prevotella sp.]|nr:rhamnogalacturonan acetylesterase [Prevotella sp.]
MRKEFIIACLSLLFSIVAKAQSFDIDLSSQPIGKPFRYSVAVPDGNYKVTVTIGSKRKVAETAVRAESRRLFFEPQKTKKKELKTLTFTVNKRSPYIYKNEWAPEGSLEKFDSIRIKSREKNYVNWDDSLTLEFCGSFPAVNRLQIERDTIATTLYLCGNSTVVDQEYEPWSSWGQMIPRWFNEQVCVANFAESGLTATSFLAQKRFDKILSTLRKGDYVFCEFGHNDQKERFEGAGAYYNFAYALKRLIDGARKKGAMVVFLTPTQRRSFTDDHLHIRETHADYPDAMREVARREQVPVIELHDMTRTLFETLGYEGSKHALVHYPANTFPGQMRELADNTHFNPYGAYEVAKMVVQGMKTLQLPLADYIRNDWKGYDPAAPDAFESFVWPDSHLYEIKKPDGN